MYTDQALTPVRDDGDETLDLFTKTTDGPSAQTAAAVLSRAGAREGCADFGVGAARRTLRTAVPLLLILRTGGGTGTTLTSVLMRHNLWGPASAVQGLVRIVHDPQCAAGRGKFKRRLKTTPVLG
jgi:hypothetical protein